MSINSTSPAFVKIASNPFLNPSENSPAININDIHSIGSPINGYCLITYNDKLNRKLQGAYISQDAASKLNIIA